jgi:hypothetical protein
MYYLYAITNRAGMVAAITALLYGIQIGGRLAIHRFDPSSFVVACFEFCSPDLVPPGLTIHTGGYDGMFYYRMALNPWTTRRTDFGIRIDNPPYRYQMILLPILAHIVALGREQWVPASIIAVNYLAVCAIGLLAGLFALAFERHALWGLAIPFYPGLLLSIDRDLTEVLMIALAMGGLYFLHRSRFLAGSCVLALSVLARETILLLVLTMLAASAVAMLRDRARRFEAASLTIPLAVFAAWQLWIFHIWGVFGFASAPANFAPFFAGIGEFVGRLAVQPNRHLLWKSELLLLAVAAALTAFETFTSATETGIKLAWAAYLILLCFLSNAVWVEDMAFMRAAAEMMVLGFLILLGARSSLLFGILAAANLAIWVAVACQRIYVI